jgi:uncharacterized membrane protein HdeD (DUF308 family)
MNPLFGEYWWLFLLRGIFALVLGIMGFPMPGTSLAILMIFLGFYMLMDGMFSIMAAVTERTATKRWGWRLGLGIFGVLAGVVTFFNPFATAIALFYLIAFWGMVIGISETIMAIRLRKQIHGEGWYILTGAVSIIFSVLILLDPLAGAITLTFLFGAYAAVIGLLLILLSFRLRNRYRQSINHISYSA